MIFTRFRSTLLIVLAGLHFARGTLRRLESSEEPDHRESSEEHGDGESHGEHDEHEEHGEREEHEERHGKENWGNFDDYWNLLTWITCCMILVSIVFDEASHRFGHWLEHKAHFHGRQSGAKINSQAYGAYGIHVRIFHRFQAEMMVLGFLTFTVWICSAAGLWEALVEGWKHLPQAKLHPHETPAKDHLRTCLLYTSPSPRDS